MHLCYHETSGETREEPLHEDRTLTIGRSNEADLVLADDRASRLHCGIRFEDGAYVVKDLKSKNGTYVNGERVESSRLQPGDRLRVGGSVLLVEESEASGQDTALREMQEAMQQGKGYGTILREIVGDKRREKPEQDARPPDA